MKRAKKLTLSALLSALTVVILWLGSALEVLDLSMAAIASLAVVFAHIELGTPYQYLLWAVSSFLSLLLIGLGTAPLLYALFAGLYPILKSYFERWPRPLEWAAKLFSLAVGVLCFWLLSRAVLLLPSPDGRWYLVLAVGVLAVVVFILYDIALSRLILFYSLRLRPRIYHLFK